MSHKHFKWTKYAKIFPRKIWLFGNFWRFSRKLFELETKALLQVAWRLKFKAFLFITVFCLFCLFTCLVFWMTGDLVGDSWRFAHRKFFQIAWNSAKAARKLKAKLNHIYLIYYIHILKFSKGNPENPNKFRLEHTQCFVNQSKIFFSPSRMQWKFTSILNIHKFRNFYSLANIYYSHIFFTDFRERSSQCNMRSSSMLIKIWLEIKRPNAYFSESNFIKIGRICTWFTKQFWQLESKICFEHEFGSIEHNGCGSSDKWKTCS